MVAVMAIAAVIIMPAVVAKTAMVIMETKAAVMADFDADVVMSKASDAVAAQTVNEEVAVIKAIAIEDNAVMEQEIHA